MPRSVESSVRVWASAWMRWSGFTPISPARPMRAARLPVIQWPIRSRRRELAQPDPEELVGRGLRDVEDEQDAGDDEEDAELVDEAVEVAPLDRVVERLVPGVQPHLHHRGQRR